MLRGKGLKPIDSVKVTPAPFLKKTPLPGIHKSSSFHVAVDALEKKLGRAATHDEVKSELARRLKSTGEARAYSSSMRAQIERANEATDGDGWSHWKPWDYLDRSKLKRHHSEGKVIEVVEEGLGDDYQTSGEYVLQISFSGLYRSGTFCFSSLAYFKRCSPSTMPMCYGSSFIRMFFTGFSYFSSWTLLSFFESYVCHYVIRTPASLAMMPLAFYPVKDHNWQALIWRGCGKYSPVGFAS